MPGRPSRCLLLLTLLISGCASQAAVERTPTPSLSATPEVTTTPSPSASPTPSPGPTPTPDPTALQLQVTSCEGGVVLSWSASTNPEFHHYTALRSPNRDVAPDYPPIAPAVDWGDTYATDPFVTSAVDASILPSETRWNYRVMAYDASGRVVAASPVRAARLFELADLGSLRIDAGSDGVTRLRWRPYDGEAACFTSYRVLYGIGRAPSTVVTVVSNQSAAEIQTDELHRGTTYQLQVQAVRSTTLGSFVVGQTDTATYTVP